MVIIDAAGPQRVQQFGREVIWDADVTTRHCRRDGRLVNTVKREFVTADSQVKRVHEVHDHGRIQQGQTTQQHADCDQRPLPPTQPPEPSPHLGPPFVPGSLAAEGRNAVNRIRGSPFQRPPYATPPLAQPRARRGAPENPPAPPDPGGKVRPPPHRDQRPGSQPGSWHSPRPAQLQQQSARRRRQIGTFGSRAGLHCLTAGDRLCATSPAATGPTARDSQSSPPGADPRARPRSRPAAGHWTSEGDNSNCPPPPQRVRTDPRAPVAGGSRRVRQPHGPGVHRFGALLCLGS